jgi:hypothetical protein
MARAPSNPLVERLLHAREVLGLPEEASLADVKQAYRSLSLSLHPDRRPPEEREEAEAAMQRVNEAYAVLECFLEHYPVPLHREALEARVFDPEQWWRDRFAGPVRGNDSD